MPKIPEEIASQTIEACAKLIEGRRDSLFGDGWIAEILATYLRDNRTTIIASVTKPEK